MEFAEMEVGSAGGFNHDDIAFDVVVIGSFNSQANHAIHQGSHSSLSANCEKEEGIPKSLSNPFPVTRAIVVLLKFISPSPCIISITNRLFPA